MTTICGKAVVPNREKCQNEEIYMYRVGLNYFEMWPVTKHIALFVFSNVIECSGLLLFNQANCVP